MARFVSLPEIDMVVADSVDGDEVVLFMRHTNEFMQAADSVPPLYKATVRDLTSIGSGVDGVACTAVDVEWHFAQSSSYTETYRVKETIAQLRTAFMRAGYGDRLPSAVPTGADMDTAYQLPRAVGFDPL